MNSKMFLDLMSKNTVDTVIEYSTPELWGVMRLADKYKIENTTEKDYQ